MKNNKFPFMLSLSLVICLILTILYYEKNNRIEVLSEKTKLNHINQINSAINQYKSSNDFIFQSIINTEDILKLQKNGLDSKDEKTKKIYRDKLYKSLIPYYKNLKTFGIKQLHFHFPDTTSFLRFHKPSKFGDNLKDVRYSLVVANKELKQVDGFEEGRIYNGYRFVYPLVYKKEHLGSVEISIGFDAINKISNKNYSIHQYMILDKDVVEGKLFSGEKKNYHKSYLNTNFYHESNTYYNLKKNFEENKKLVNIEIFDKINRELNINTTTNTLLGYKHLVKFLEIDGLYYFASLLPIKNLKAKNIGYIVSYERCECINGINQEFYTKILILLLMSLVVIYFYYKNEKYKQNLWELNNNLNKTVADKTKELQKYLDIINKNITISTTDLKGYITYANNSFCKMSGYSSDELIGSKHSIIRHPDMDVDIFKKMWSTLKKGELWQGKLKNISKDGSYYWIDAIIEPTIDDDNKVVSYTAIGIDITDKIELENITKNQELVIQQQTKIANSQRDKAIEASKTKSEFLANMSHEIRTPLNAIIGFIELLKEDEQDAKKQKYLDIVHNSSNTLLEIINDILDFSKIESGKLSIEKIEFDIAKEYILIKRQFKARLVEKNIHLYTGYNVLPKILVGDILRIKQVINNLMSNAIKFTPENKSIYLDLSYKEQRLYVKVKDEGIGISKEYQKTIFEPFTQEDSSTTRKYGGTGLGLTISHTLIKLMNGEIKVKSILGVGSEFSFDIPLQVGENTITKEEKQEEKELKGKILLVEDNKANQMFMKVVLKKMKLEFEIASDGLEAVDMFKANKYDLVLMDENMPNMNGIVATK
ncbi:MAG: ATP-binding protein, partial [Campylobacterota bacterium]|nr:ATP-binding protein [Campylobacterota bacterium]